MGSIRTVLLATLVICSMLLVLATGCRSDAASQADNPTPCRYRFPVQPASEARYDRAHHDYPATDIFAPRGARFLAPTSGTVDFVSSTDTWDPKPDDPAKRGGLSIAIVGDDGVRYYGSHLLEITDGLRRGDRVTAGTLLGDVGSSGNARDVRPHLHFGLSRPTSSTDWEVRRGQVRPYEYLNAWRKGDDITPRIPGARSPTCTPAR